MVFQFSETGQRVAADLFSSPLSWTFLVVAARTWVGRLLRSISVFAVAQFLVHLYCLVVAAFIFDFGPFKPGVGFFDQEAFEVVSEGFFSDDGGDELVVVLLGVDEVFEQIDLLLCFFPFFFDGSQVL